MSTVSSILNTELPIDRSTRASARKLVLIDISERCGQRASVPQIAKRCAMAQRTASEAISALVEDGYVTASDDPKVRSYTVNTDKLEGGSDAH